MKDDSQQAMLRCALRVLDEYRYALGNSRAGERHNQHVAAMLAASLHDITAATITLVGTAGESAVGVLCRAVVETFAKLCNCCGDEDYAKKIHADSLVARAGVWDAYRSIPGTEADSTLVLKASARIDADRKLAQDIRSMQKPGYTAPKDKFRTSYVPAGIAAMYGLYCSPAHGDVQHLLDCYFRDDENYHLAAKLPHWVINDALRLGTVTCVETLLRLGSFAKSQPRDLSHVLARCQRDLDTMRYVSDLEVASIRAAHGQ
jgi:hypothetical protein